MFLLKYKYYEFIKCKITYYQKMFMNIFQINFLVKVYKYINKKLKLYLKLYIMKIIQKLY